jgi:hypothetical protein
VTCDKTTGTPVFSTYKTDRHDVTEILLNTINQPANNIYSFVENIKNCILGYYIKNGILSIQLGTGVIII